MCVTAHLYFYVDCDIHDYLELVVNEMIYLIVGGVPKACHVELSGFSSQGSKRENST